MACLSLAPVCFTFVFRPMFAWVMSTLLGLHWRGGRMPSGNECPHTCHVQILWKMGLICLECYSLGFVHDILG